MHRKTLSHSCCLQICPGHSPAQQTPAHMGSSCPGGLGFGSALHSGGMRALESLSPFAGQLSPGSPHPSCTCGSHMGGHAGSDPEVPKGVLRWWILTLGAMSTYAPSAASAVQAEHPRAGPVQGRAKKGAFGGKVFFITLRAVSDCIVGSSR